ncbi:MAG: hypothetical protein AAGJ08_04810 [Cyanobacteria bacterium P01_H01_bin.35]
MRFASILPERLNFKKYSRYIDEELLEFLKVVMPRNWSQHPYQVGKLSYKLPEFVVTTSELGKEASYPIWFTAKVDSTVETLLGSGSGKDSLLCSLILESAGVKYDIITYFYDIYGDNSGQETLFQQVTSHLKFRNQHGIYLNDEYYGWLKNRLSKTNIIARTKDYFGKNRFCADGGETLLTAMAMIPIQIVHGIPLLSLGHEKSADAPNLIEPESGEAIAHQWVKSLTFHQVISKFIARMFDGVNVVSLTKPIHDVKIFDLLFQLDNQLPYATNSCNVQKPWCGRCEKCCYVFAGFCAYGEVSKTIQAFGKNLLEMEENLPVWEDLLGLNGYIAWECVGLPEETEWYFYKLYVRGVKGRAIDLFEQKVLNPLKSKGEGYVEKYFSEIEQQFSQVYENHHTMPEWLWQKIQPVLEN